MSYKKLNIISQFDIFTIFKIYINLRNNLLKKYTVDSLGRICISNPNQSINA